MDKKFDLLSKLPQDLLDNYIFPHLDYNLKIFLNKEFYNNINSRFFIEKKIGTNFEIYLREIIRRDYSFIFQNIINEKLDRWFKKSNYKFYGIIYQNYLFYLLDYSIKYKSPKCELLIKNGLDKLYPYEKKRHKKMYRKGLYNNKIEWMI